MNKQALEIICHLMICSCDWNEEKTENAINTVYEGGTN